MKRARVARAMTMVMRMMGDEGGEAMETEVEGDKEGEGGKMMAAATRVAGERRQQ